MDFEFQEDGFLAKILLEQGAKDVPVGTPIGVYVEDEADVAAFKDFTAADAGSAPKSASESPKSSEPADSAESKSEKSAEPSKEAAPEPSKPTESSSESSDRIKASPIAKLIALEKGIPLKDIKGSGPEGRIIKRDVENWKPVTSPSASKSAAASQSASSAAPAAAEYEDIPISSMRKTIATRLQQSKQNSPHYTISSTLSVSKLLKLRAALNTGADGEYKLSVNDLLVKAIAVANTKVPAVNTSWLDAEGVMRQYKNVDVSVAVATHRSHHTCCQEC